MNALVYTRFELLRTFRSRRFFIFALGFPLGLYFLIAAPNHDVKDLGGSGISAPLYFMIGLAAFGSMNAMLSTGARIAGERQVGWNRQLRLTPLSTRMYFRVKVLVGYMTAVLSILTLYVAGATLGVRLDAGHWVEMTLFMLIGLVPFAAIGIFLGHQLTVDSIGPAMGGTTALLGFLGGVWFPITDGTLRTIAELLPSYWLVQAAHIGLGGDGWGAKGWIVILAWTAGGAALARWAYRRDTKRV